MKKIKPVIVLLIIAVISGAILSILNFVLHVDDSVRLSRAIQSVYGKQVEATEEEIDQTFTSSYGKLLNVYSFEDEGTLYKLYKSEGNNGYHNGTVTLWILVSFNGTSPNEIVKVTLADSSKQTLMSKLTGEFYSAYQSIDLSDIQNGYIVSVDNSGDLKNIATGATKSSNATNNSVNTVLEYLKEGK